MNGNAWAIIGADGPDTLVGIKAFYFEGSGQVLMTNALVDDTGATFDVGSRISGEELAARAWSVDELVAVAAADGADTEALDLRDVLDVAETRTAALLGGDGTTSVPTDGGTGTDGVAPAPVYDPLQDQVQTPDIM